MSDQCSIYVVVFGAAQKNRTQGLADFATDECAVTFVSTTPVEVVPATNLVVRPWRNPLGVLRRIGLGRVQRAIERFIYFPSRTRLYVRPVVRMLRHRIRADQAAGRRVVVVTVSTPFDVPLVGRRLKRRFPDVRWVIDWQDYWTLDPTYLRRTPAVYRRFAHRLERHLFQEADVNVVLNEFAVDHVVTSCASPADRTVAIPHHISDADRRLADQPWAQRSSSANPALVYLGGMFKPPKVRGDLFLAGFRQLRVERDLRASVHVYGSAVQAAPFAADPRFGLCIEDPVPAADVIHTLRRYDFLLLLLEDLPGFSRLVMHLKLPEYLIAGPPIIAVVPADSNVARIIERTGTGFVVPVGDPGWTDRVAAILTGERTMPRRVPVEIAQFMWPAVRKRWSEALGLAGDAADDRSGAVS